MKPGELKILFVSSSNKKKKLSPFILSQGDSLQKLGLRIDFYTIDKSGLKGYLIHLFRLKTYLRKNKYDIIHAHYALSGFISFFAKRKEILITSLMGCDILGSYGRDGEKIWRHQLIPFATRIFSRSCWDYVIVKSTNMIPRLPAETKYSVIPNGVDFDFFKPFDYYLCRKKLGFQDGFKYILFPTNPEREEKNFELANKAFKILRSDSELKIELLIVYKLDPADLVVYYNAADVCILTSHSEGSPNVIKEAMACNLPVVSTDVGDVREIISGVEGCFISASEPTAFANMIRMSLDFNRRTNGRDKIKHLEIGIIAGKIRGIYKDLVS